MREKERELSVKILVILTGGTIGSLISENVINVKEGASAKLIEMYQEKEGNDIEFEVIQPLNILSENLDPSYWEVLCDCLDQVELNQYQGIIITHGSDTLSYTAAMIGLCYSHTSIPIVLIASNYALQDERSNGFANFYYAVCFIKEEQRAGVFAVYQNNKEENIVYLATRLKEADTYLDQFSSFGSVDFGKIAENGFWEIIHEQNPARQEMQVHTEKWRQEKFRYIKKVLLIHSYPGLDYNSILLDSGIGAVLFATYHSATVCGGTKQCPVEKFLKKCKGKGIEVYACSFKPVEDFYATSTELLRQGVIPLVNISTEAAYAKLILAYNQPIKDRKTFMNKNIYFEILPELKMKK